MGWEGFEEGEGRGRRGGVSGGEEERGKNGEERNGAGGGVVIVDGGGGGGASLGPSNVKRLNKVESDGRGGLILDWFLVESFAGATTSFGSDADFLLSWTGGALKNDGGASTGLEALKSILLDEDGLGSGLVVRLSSFGGGGEASCLGVKRK